MSTPSYLPDLDGTGEHRIERWIHLIRCVMVNGITTFVGGEGWQHPLAAGGTHRNGCCNRDINKNYPHGVNRWRG